MKIKRLTAILIVVTMILSMGTMSFAANNDSSNHTVIVANGIMPFGLGDCPYGTHDMKHIGWGTLYKGVSPNGTCVFSGGHAWQCQKCYLVCVTQFDANDKLGPIGIYACWDYNEKINTDIYMWVTTYSQTNNSSISGFTFRY